jgi:hypothetical protein
VRRHLSISVLAVGLYGLPLASAEPAYVGAEGCRTCHAQAYQQWQTTPHARAFERLVGAERTNPTCVGCHATNAASGLVGVQCESCHGAGGVYWPAYVMQDRGLAEAVGLQQGDQAEICGRCHTADQPSLVPFDVSSALRLVRHKGER